MIHLACPNLAKTSSWNTLQDISGSYVDGTTSMDGSCWDIRETLNWWSESRSLVWLWTELMDSSLSPTKRRALRNDTQPCRLFCSTSLDLLYNSLFYIHNTELLLRLLLSFLNSLAYIFIAATHLPYTNAILSRWLSSVEPFVNIRLSGVFT